MKPWSRSLAGRLDELLIESRALAGNPLGDPDRRPLYVYTPPGYEEEPTRRYPSIYRIQGLTGQLDMWRNRQAFTENPIELADAIFTDGDTPPAIIVYVDAWTSLGGSQFLDSPGTGRYHTYLCEEVVSFVDARYRTLPAPEHRAIAGKSSGGYGAMVTPMLRPDLFGAFATHAGDALFEACYLPDLREAVRALRDEYDGSYDAFWSSFRSRPGRGRRSDGVLLNMYCMAACYSADPDGTVQLPVEITTGELLPEIWDRWLAWDPVRMARRRAAALRGQRAMWIDAGRSDEFYLDVGAQAFHAELRKAGIGEGENVRFELFEGTHSGIEWRYPLALRFLAQRIAERIAPQ
ncbi:MAG: alpha/beta hydrolase-fold protein [Chloroflexota bacterium]|nr:alpha/beta hydrolase-fold protein [Chloroflexota bacterium]